MIEVNEDERKVTWAELGNPAKDGDYTVPGFDLSIRISRLNIGEASGLMADHGVKGDRIQVSLIRWTHEWTIVGGVMTVI